MSAPGRLHLANATIVDGTGAPAYSGFVVIDGDRIAQVARRGAPEPAEGPQRVDAAGRVLCPGFVDVHTHSDLSPFVDPWMPSMLRQGVTTVVVGNCGSSPWPPAGRPDLETEAGVRPGELDLGWRSFGDYLDRVDASRPAVNLAALVGHGALRREVMGGERRPPMPAELAAMRRLTIRAMEDGAVGLSTGLIYVPGMYATTEEILALAGVVAPFEALYASHIRGEGANLFDAVGEALEIGRRANVPVHVSHLKCETEPMWGHAGELLAVVDMGEATADQYPYTAWASVLWSLLPEWAPVHELADVVGDAEHRARLVHVVEHGEPGWQSSVGGVGWNQIVVESTTDDRWNGMSIAQIGEARGETPFDSMISLLLEAPETMAIGHAMHEDDVRAILARPEIMVASDGAAMSPAGPLGRFPVHPRNYGTFPRVLGRYVRDERILPLETAVRKMTALPAARFALGDRGVVREGAVADLVLFDPARVRDTATFEAPHAFPEGIDLVIVGGRVGWDGQRGERAGRVVRRSGV